MTIEAADILHTFVVIDPAQHATGVAVTPTVFADLDKNFNGFKGHELISAYTFDADWTSWERHPAGDEIVMLLAGQATFFVDIDGQHHSVVLEKPGTYVIVPQGLWHTAKTQVQTKMLFITPGEGTENRKV